jgi:hypothetical protein
MKSESHSESAFYTNDQSGMDLRDWFAALALSEIMATRPHETPEKKALESYQIADSMMRQRERPASGL